MTFTHGWEETSREMLNNLPTQLDAVKEADWSPWATVLSGIVMLPHLRRSSKDYGANCLKMYDFISDQKCHETDHMLELRYIVPISVYVH